VKTLLAGPDYALEFGWLLMAWVPYVRFMAAKYDRVVVVCSPGNEYLYQDFTSKFVPYNKNGARDRWLMDGKKAKMPAEIWCNFLGSDVIVPGRQNCMGHQKKYVKYGGCYEEFAYKIVVHARAIDVRDSADRNWQPGKYQLLLEMLRKKMLIDVCSIGTKKGAYHIPGTHDMRGIPLEKCCDILASSGLLIGPSSGPMHLGELCGIPRIVWTIDKELKILGYKTNKWRYKKQWRPFNTAVKIIEGPTWRPAVKTVYRKVLKALQ